MSSKEFWEDEPQLYWAYRFSFEKRIEFEQKKETEQIRLLAWLNGVATNTAVSIALKNGFGKKGQTPTQFPTFKEFYKLSEEANNPIKKELEARLEGVKDKNEKGAIEFNYWARL